MPGASPDDPGHERVDGGQARMAHPAAAHARPGYPSPATAAVPARSAAAGEQAIADHRESGPEDQPRGQHQQVGRGHPASTTCRTICQAKASRSGRTARVADVIAR
jgi:hypothetical protein